mgnify:CR=1 FL=1
MNRKRLLIGGGLLIGIIFSGIALYLIFQGPHMRVQQNIRAFQAVTPLPPPGSLPRGIEPSPTTPEEARLRNPLEDTAQNRARGKVYYYYYCIFCHGERGDGSAPVGDSYMPKPSNLRQLKRDAYDDGKLLRAMLTGTGHEPVLERVVHPKHRWPLLLYVRTLIGKEDDLPGR